MVELARSLLGQRLVAGGVGGRIVETEAYHQDEPACHAHRGETPRNRSMFQRGGTLYVYRIHQSVCCNVVAGPAGAGVAVLIRAILPELGREQIAERRAPRRERDWTNGPGKLCAALGIGLELDGTSLIDGPVQVWEGAAPAPERVVAGPRIGISKAVELPWRFVLSG